ncbi:MAG: hypothetical protein JZU65_22495, partial [Chlorobium sp.]|nr:hypothetical protein [Chlorobium sp.]
MPALDQLNILIVCEHASDMFGGEAVLPLRYFQLLEQRGYNVYLLTHERVRARLEHLHGLTKQNVYYIPDTKLHVLLHHISSKIPDRVSVITVGALMHLLTQCYQRVLAKKIVRTRHIDIIHEPSPVSPRQPSMMFGMGCPVVIGPMNGGMDFPPCFS